MLHVEKWAENKPRMFAIIAIMQVASTVKVFPLMDSIVKGNLNRTDLPLVPLENWLSLYKNHRRVWGWFVNMLQGYAPDALDLVNLSLSLSEVPEEKHQGDARKAIDYMEQENQQAWDKIHAANLKDIKQDVLEIKEGKNACENGVIFDVDVLAQMHLPEAQFLLFMWLPCYNLYGETPLHLLRKSRSANIQSLDRLFRLDKSAVFDPKIAQIMHRLSVQKPTQYRKLLEALNGRPKRRMSLSSFKVSLAAYIWLLAKIMGCDLTEPEIRGLFDAIAKDYGSKYDIDLDLPESSEAFYMGIYREVPFWKGFLLSVLPR